MTEAPGSATRTPDSLLRGLVSTVLTLTGPASMFPAGIVGILRFFFVVRRRCACDVSTVDTDDPPDLLHRPFGASRATDPIAELLPEPAPQKP